MDERRYDVVIIGGGPAGLAAAVELHKQGIQTFFLHINLRYLKIL